ncbi:MAG: hypothetical protein HY303_09275 [Candidatus Wallbacteria bacterium]|nr:hypothetical protein [Candidatus Wallbacteria bacterium]
MNRARGSDLALRWVALAGGIFAAAAIRVAFGRRYRSTVAPSLGLHVLSLAFSAPLSLWTQAAGKSAAGVSPPAVRLAGLVAVSLSLAWLLVAARLARVPRSRLRGWLGARRLGALVEAVELALEPQRPEAAEPTAPPVRRGGPPGPSDSPCAGPRP